MEVKLLENAQVFLDEYGEVLLKQEALSQLVLSSAMGVINARTEAGGMFGVVNDGDKPILLFSNVIPNNLAIYVAENSNAVDAAVALADFLGISHVSIAGINARNDICTSFMEQYKKHTGCTFAEKLGMDILEVRSLNDITPIEGYQRLALPEEEMHATDWMLQFQMEAKTSEMDYEAALNTARRLIREHKIYYFENEDGEVVSMAVIGRQLIHGITITYIFTPEEHRGKGYAAANVYYLSKYLLEQGNEFCTIFVDKKNPLSERAYEKVGYYYLEDIYEYIVIPTEI